MSEETYEQLDPRIRRTRQLLQDGLCILLKKKDLDKISVQDVADAATVNRATFYDHYADKFALLECMVGTRFHALLAGRAVQFGGSCASELKALVLAVCDYITQGDACKLHPQPHVESAIVAVIRRVLLEGLKQHPPQNSVSPEMIAATASWAIYGAAKEWAQTPDRASSERIADTVMVLVAPILQLPATPGAPHAG